MAARFAIATPVARSAIEDYVARWPDRYTAETGGSPLTVLTVSPHVVDRAPGIVDIVFDGRPGSRLWRDLLVHFMGRVPQIAGITFAGFYDLVSGMPHQGSLPEP